MHVFPLLISCIFLLILTRDNILNFIINVDMDVVAAPSQCQSEVHVCLGRSDLHSSLEKQTLLLSIRGVQIYSFCQYQGCSVTT